MQSPLTQEGDVKRHWPGRGLLTHAHYHRGAGDNSSGQERATEE